jgi:hypothetical protein
MDRGGARRHRADRGPGGRPGRRGRRGRVRLIGLAVATLGGVLLGACSSNAAPPSTTGATTTSGASSSTTTSTAPPASTSTTVGIARCATSALSGSVSGSSGAAGTIETTVALKSTAPTPCTLGGYPGLQMLNSAGTGLATTVVRKGSYSFTAMAPTTVTLATGQSAYFNIGFSDVPSGSETSCPTSASLEVTPPNATDHLVVAATLAPCSSGTLVVSPLFLSTGAASQTTAPPSS